MAEIKKENNEKIKSAWKLAGKLALSARLVINANAKNISQRIDEMEDILDAYDNEIISLISGK